MGPSASFGAPRGSGRVPILQAFAPTAAHPGYPRPGSGSLLGHAARHGRLGGRGGRARTEAWLPMRSGPVQAFSSIFNAMAEVTVSASDVVLINGLALTCSVRCK